MVKDPRTPKPGSSEPDDALDLLRALARSRGTHPASPEQARAPPAGDEAEKLDALRALAETLDRQLKSPRPDAGPAPQPAAPRRPTAHDWRAAARQQWTALAASLPEPADLIPRFGREQLIYLIVAAMVLAIAVYGGLFGGRTPSGVAVGPVPTVTPPAQIVPPTTPAEPAPPADIPAINKAMADCDAMAARDSQSLYFLVLPLVPSNPNDPSWRAVALQTIGTSYLLLSAKDALDGLTGKRLVLRPGRYTFSVLDAGSGATYSWTSATGVARLTKRDSGAVKTLKLGFDFSQAQTGAQWSAEFKRDPGTCYWVSALIRE